MSLNLVKYNFNNAANTYLEHAALQKHCAQKMLAMFDECHQSGWVLDLGSGPGTTLHQSSQQVHPTICYDISLAMLQTAKAHGSGMVVNGDASFLPFASNSIQTVICNLMLQWSGNKTQMLSEIERVLVPHGHLIFTTLIEPSLWQLQAAWATIDSAKHTLHFLSEDYYQKLCQTAGLRLIHAETWHHEMHFADMQSLFRHFKATGTTLPKSARGHGLGGKKTLTALASAYNTHITHANLSLSYHPLLLMVKKDSIHRV